MEIKIFFIEKISVFIDICLCEKSIVYYVAIYI